MRVLFIFLAAFIGQANGISSQNLSFIENKNQWTEAVKFKADVPSGHVYFAKNFFRYVFYNLQDLDRIHEKKHEHYIQAYNEKINCYAYDLQFVGSNEVPEISRGNKLAAFHNYFLGNDPSHWAGKVGLFESVTYQNMYPGVDVQVYGKGNSLKYDVIVKAKADPSAVRLNYYGVTSQLNKQGALEMSIGFNTIQESAPYTYQIIQGKKVTINSQYKLHENGEITFEFPNGYNKNYDLIIDPTLVFSTYSSSTATTYGFSATYDLAGSLYAGGECFGVGWPSSVGAFQLTFAGGVDAGINKYTPNGNALVYSTYYGGQGYDLPNNMVVNPNNELAITGSTSSSNLPVTFGCYDNSLGGSQDAYVAHFDANGSTLIGATYVGGSSGDAQNDWSVSPNYGDGNRGEIMYDTNGDILVAVSTQSPDFPTTGGAYQTTFGGGTQDGCVFKLNSTCSNLLFSTFLGGAGTDACFSIVKNSLGNWVVAGGTNSNNFPTTAGSYLAAQPGGVDGFVTVLNNGGSALVNSTYLGTTSFDHAFKVQVDNNDTVYVCGQTDGPGFPVSPGVYSNAGGNIFFMKFVPNLSTLTLSTIIGNTSSTLIPTAFLKDNCGNVYFTGFGAGTGLALTANAHQTTPGGFWLSVLTGDFTNLVYATYMGAGGDHVDGGTSRFDPQGIVYHSVCTASASQYQSPGCLSPTNQAGSWDVASFKFNFDLAPITASLTITPNDTGCAPYLMFFQNTSTSAASYEWDFGDGGTSTVTSPTHTFLNPGSYLVRLIAINNNSCNPRDTAYVTVNIIEGVDASFSYDVNLGCSDDTVVFSINNQNAPPNVTYMWYFGDGAQSNLKNVSHVYNAQNIYNVMCVATNGFCRDTAYATIDLNHYIDANFYTSTTTGSLPVDSICLGQNLFASAVLSFPQGFLEYFWNWGDGTTTPYSTNFIGSHMYTKGGAYTITLYVKDTLGCLDSLKQNVFVEDASFQNVGFSDSLVCVGEPIHFYDSLGTTVPAFYWDFGDGNIINNLHNPTHAWDKSGSYVVSLTANYQICPDQTSSVNVEVDDYPDVHLGKDTAICPGMTGSILLNNLMNTAMTLLWSTGENSNSITVTQPGYYWASATSPNAGCRTTDSIWIQRDCYINIPNSFSPNNDGLNDYFFPRELLSSGVKSFRMNIYNRWGENIFTTDKIDGRGWDGQYNGKPQNMGVYVYVMDVEFINKIKKSYKGNVTLVK